MSLITTADELREQAKEHLSKAYSCLIKVLDEDTWGSKEYRKEYIDRLHDITKTIRQIKDL